MPQEEKLTNRQKEPSFITSPFTAQLKTYISNIDLFLNIQETPSEKIDKTLRIIDRNNQIAKLIESDDYRAIAQEEIGLRGNTKLGFVYCIDGRIPTIFLAGRFANVWEEPAGLIGLQSTADGKQIPKSTLLDEALREAAGEERDLLEIFFAHTSLSVEKNTCGYMNKLKQDENIEESIDLTTNNLQRFENQQIPAVTEFYNRVRVQQGKSSLTRVGISAVYDTDTMGIVLGYGRDQSLSTSEITNRLSEKIEFILSEDLGGFGSMLKTFTDPDFFIEFSKRVLGITKFLLEWDKLNEEIDPYIEKNYSDLTVSQKQALKFTLIRTISMQYVTGLSNIPDNGPDHSFSHHGEDYLALSMGGKTVGRFDPEKQVFGSTPSDTASAIEDVKVKLSIMDHNNGQNSQILFVSNPVKKLDWDKYCNDESESHQRNIALNANLFRAIISDDQLSQRIKKGNLIVIPVLVDQNTGEILEILDHSVYA